MSGVGGSRERVVVRYGEGWELWIKDEKGAEGWDGRIWLKGYLGGNTSV